MAFWDAALLFVSFFYYFYIIIIKSLTFSSHHCEIPALFELKCNLKGLFVAFLCRFNILSGGNIAGEGEGIQGEVSVLLVSCLSPWTRKTEENESIFCNVLPWTFSILCPWLLTCSESLIEKR